jgi:UDP-N-acetylmuramyl pentapeptide synthase
MRVSEKRSIKTYPTMEALCSELEKCNFQNSSFLIKGSRGMKMERALEAIR